MSGMLSTQQILNQLFGTKNWSVQRILNTVFAAGEVGPDAIAAMEASLANVPAEILAAVAAAGAQHLQDYAHVPSSSVLVAGIGQGFDYQSVDAAIGAAVNPGGATLGSYKRGHIDMGALDGITEGCSFVIATENGPRTYTEGSDFFFYDSHGDWAAGVNHGRSDIEAVATENGIRVSLKGATELTITASQDSGFVVGEFVLEADAVPAHLATVIGLPGVAAPTTSAPGVTVVLIEDVLAQALAATLVAATLTTKQQEADVALVAWHSDDIVASDTRPGKCGWYDAAVELGGLTPAMYCALRGVVFSHGLVTDWIGADAGRMSINQLRTLWWQAGHELGSQSKSHTGCPTELTVADEVTNNRAVVQALTGAFVAVPGWTIPTGNGLTDPLTQRLGSPCDPFSNPGSWETSGTNSMIVTPLREGYLGQAIFNTYTWSLTYGNSGAGAYGVGDIGKDSGWIVPQGFDLAMVNPRTRTQIAGDGPTGGQTIGQFKALIDSLCAARDADTLLIVTGSTLRAATTPRWTAIGGALQISGNGSHSDLHVELENGKSHLLKIKAHVVSGADVALTVQTVLSATKADGSGVAVYVSLPMEALGADGGTTLDSGLIYRAFGVPVWCKSMTLRLIVTGTNPVVAIDSIQKVIA